MPMYDARCPACQITVEFFRRMADCDDLPSCPTCHGPMDRVFSVPMITADIQPYRAVTTDIKTGEQPYITSRREHTEFLKRNGLRQFEADSSKPGRDSAKERQERRNDILQSIHQVTGA